MREAAYVVHTRYFTYTHSYTTHTHNWASLHSVLHSVSLLHINYKGKWRSISNSISQRWCHIPRSLVSLPASPALSASLSCFPLAWFPSMHFSYCGAGGSRSQVCVCVCVRHPLQETVLAKFCTSGKMTLSEKGGNPGLTLFLQKACRVFEMLCCYCQRWVQLLLCCFEKCIPLIPMINCRNRYLWWLELGFCHPFSSKIIF